jgi:thiamine-phosphate pyrophosphorylase
MTDKHDERMRSFLAAGLYLVTSASTSVGRTTLEILRCALNGGVKLVQLREKDVPTRELVELARAARTLTEASGALLIINDRLDVALAVNADGVHLGREDLPVPCARAIAPDMIIGASSHSVAEATEAQASGASYVNIGPLFPTGTKKWEGEFLGMEGLHRISSALSVPFTVMGGIKPEHISRLVAAGARTIAVVTAVTAADDPSAASRELISLIKGTDCRTRTR